MKPSVVCPKCGSADFDLSAYESMIVLTRDLALFTLRCTHCDARVSSLCSIPPEPREEVQFAAIEIGAGMGYDL